MAVAGRSWLHALLDLVFPPRCAGCGRRGVWLCDPCVAALVRLGPPFCRYCGRPTGGVQTCPDCWRHRPALDGVRSPYLFEGPLRLLIHRFKYRHAAHLAGPLAALLADGDAVFLAPVEAIVPVPLHPRRLRQRGYNQAALLATALAPRLGLPVVEGCLQRVRDTPPQMGLPAAERRRHVRGAFQCANQSLAGRIVLLIDDVCTTSATLDACAVALKRSGAIAVSGLTLARAR